jgi:hypothetical protein
MYTEHKIWRSISKWPHVPMYQKEDTTFIPKEDIYVEEDITLIEKDDKAYSTITMALATKITHGFKEFTTAKSLWGALVERFEGNEDIHASRKDMSRQDSTCSATFEEKQ